jgi:cysteine desulfurase/selenocysteine lyase
VSKTLDWRKDFPLFNHNESLVYLDSAATAHKPQGVINAIHKYYSEDNANVHRAVYTLSERASRDYEAARHRVQSFINAADSHEVIFTHGATDAINLVATSFGNRFVKAGDEIVISEMEHHSNIVPWQLLCDRVGALLKVIPVNDDGSLNIDIYQQLLTARTKLVAITQVSNVLGTINPVKSMIAMAHEKNIPVLLDGAQAVAHLPVDVQDLDCDFYVFSAHKLYGPTGIGILYGKTQWLEQMPPYQGGGRMISRVSLSDKTTYDILPYKFEAGTPPISGVIGLGAAIDYVNHIGYAALAEHEQELLKYTNQAFSEIPLLSIIGNAPHKVGVISFILDGIHAHDVGTILGNSNIAIRVGHHCAMPLMDRFGVAATARVSLALYNNKKDIDLLMEGLRQAIELLGRHHG